jgi:hypothetical protein
MPRSLLQESELGQEDTIVHGHLMARVWYLAQIHPPTERVREATEHHDRLVFMARGYISCATVNTTKEEG